MLKLAIKSVIIFQLIGTFIVPTSEDSVQREKKLAANSVFANQKLFHALDQLFPSIKENLVKSLKAYVDIVGKEAFVQELHHRFPATQTQGISKVLYSHLNDTDKQGISEEDFLQLLGQSFSPKAARTALISLFGLSPTCSLPNFKDEGLLALRYNEFNKENKNPISKEEFIKILNSQYPEFKNEGLIESEYKKQKEDVCKELALKIFTQNSNIEKFLQILNGTSSEIKKALESNLKPIVDEIKKCDDFQRLFIKEDFLKNIDNNLLRDEGVTEFLYQQLKNYQTRANPISKEELCEALDKFLTFFDDDFFNADPNDPSENFFETKKILQQWFKVKNIEINSPEQFHTVLYYLLGKLKKDEEFVESVLKAYTIFKDTKEIQICNLPIADCLKFLDGLLSTLKRDKEIEREVLAKKEKREAKEFISALPNETILEIKKEFLNSLNQIGNQMRRKFSPSTEELFTILDSAVAGFKGAFENKEVAPKEKLPQTDLKIPHIIDIDIHNTALSATSV